MALVSVGPLGGSIGEGESDSIEGAFIDVEGFGASDDGDEDKCDSDRGAAAVATMSFHSSISSTSSPRPRPTQAASFRNNEPPQQAGGAQTSDRHHHEQHYHQQDYQQQGHFDEDMSVMTMDTTLREMGCPVGAVHSSILQDMTQPASYQVYNSSSSRGLTDAGVARTQTSHRQQQQRPPRAVRRSSVPPPEAFYHSSPLDPPDDPAMTTVSVEDDDDPWRDGGAAQRLAASEVCRPDSDEEDNDGFPPRGGKLSFTRDQPQSTPSGPLPLQSPEMQPLSASTTGKNEAKDTNGSDYQVQLEEKVTNLSLELANARSKVDERDLANRKLAEENRSLHDMMEQMRQKMERLKRDNHDLRRRVGELDRWYVTQILRGTTSIGSKTRMLAVSTASRRGLMGQLNRTPATSERSLSSSMHSGSSKPDLTDIQESEETSSTEADEPTDATGNSSALDRDEAEEGMWVGGSQGGISLQEWPTPESSSPVTAPSHPKETSSSERNVGGRRVSKKRFSYQSSVGSSINETDEDSVESSCVEDDEDAAYVVPLDATEDNEQRHVEKAEQPPEKDAGQTQASPDLPEQKGWPELGLGAVIGGLSASLGGGRQQSFSSRQNSWMRRASNHSETDTATRRQRSTPTVPSNPVDSTSSAEDSTVASQPSVLGGFFHRHASGKSRVDTGEQGLDVKRHGASKGPNSSPASASVSSSQEGFSQRETVHDSVSVASNHVGPEEGLSGNYHDNNVPSNRTASHSADAQRPSWVASVFQRYNSVGNVIKDPEGIGSPCPGAGDDGHGASSSSLHLHQPENGCEEERWSECITDHQEDFAMDVPPVIRVTERTTTQPLLPPPEESGKGVLVTWKSSKRQQPPRRNSSSSVLVRLG